MAFDSAECPRLGQSVLLGNGVRVRLRLAHFSDLGAIAELIQCHGESLANLHPERLVQFDPRRRYVVCARALVDGTERLAGLGAIDLVAPPGEPEMLICDPEFGEDLPHVLARVLRGAAQASVRAHAA